MGKLSLAMTTEYLPPEPEPITLMPRQPLVLDKGLLKKQSPIQERVIKECARKWTEVLRQLPPPPPNQEWWPTTTTHTDETTGAIMMTITPVLRWLPGTPQNPCAPED